MLPLVGAAAGGFEQLGPLLLVKPGGVGHIAADGGMFGPKFFDEMVKVVEQRRDVAFAAEETRNAADADEAVSVADGLDRVVRLAAKVFVNAAAGGVAGHHGPRAGLGGIVGCLPAAVRHIGDDAELVHLRAGCMAEIAQATIVGLSGTIA